MDRAQMSRLGTVALTALGSLLLTACGGDSQSTRTTPALPPDAVAVVADAPDGTITVEEFERALTQTAARQGLKSAPTADDPRYEQFRDSAISDLLLGRWVLGEGEGRGIEVTDREIDAELEKVKSQEFGSEEEFQQFLDESGFTLDEARDRVGLQLVSQRIQAEVLGDVPTGGTSSPGGLAQEQRELATEFQAEFKEKWRSRTQCADEYLIDRCANGPSLSDEDATENDPLDTTP